MSSAASPHASRHQRVAAVILAAGKGTRMGSDLAKVLHPLAGRPLISHVLSTCADVGLGRSVVVVGYQRERVEQAVQPWGARCVLQDPQLGTGHAVLCAETEIGARGGIDCVLVLCGDCPMVPATLIDRLLRHHRDRAAACTAVGARLTDPGRYGRMITDAAGHLVRIVEYKDASAEERAVTLINSGIYAFSASDLFSALKRITPNNAQGEYYLTDAVAMLVGAGKLVELVETDDAAAVMGINTPAELQVAERVISGRAS